MTTGPIHNFYPNQTLFFGDLYSFWQPIGTQAYFIGHTSDPSPVRPLEDQLPWSNADVSLSPSGPFLDVIIGGEGDTIYFQGDSSWGTWQISSLTDHIEGQWTWTPEPSPLLLILLGLLALRRRA